MSVWGKCDLAEDQLKAFTRSAVRMKTLLCLIEEDMDSGDLEKKIGTRASTILHTIKDLTEKELVIKSKRGYALTNVGRIQAMLLDDLVEAIVALDQHKEFWLTHDLSGIPPELQKKIGVLINSDLVTQEPADILKSHEYFLQKLVHAKEIYGVSPIIAPGHAEVVREAIKNGARVELLLTDNILKIAAKENPDLLGNLLKYDNFSLYHLDEDIRVAFTVTDTLLSLGMYRLDGAYDLGRDLFCTEEEALAWGMKLFEYYRSRAELIKKN
jgi:predicted transcriptional regulator